MTLEKLSKLRDKYAEKVEAYRSAVRGEDKATVKKTQAAMKTAGKGYLKGIQTSAEKHSEVEVWAIVQPKAK